MAWHSTANKPSSDPMMILFTDAYIPGLNVLILNVLRLTNVLLYDIFGFRLILLLKWWSQCGSFMYIETKSFHDANSVVTRCTASYKNKLASWQSQVQCNWFSVHQCTSNYSLDIIKPNDEYNHQATNLLKFNGSKGILRVQYIRWYLIVNCRIWQKLN